MRNRRVIALAAIAVLAIAGLGLVMSRDKRVLAFTLGVRATNVAAVVKPGEEACQRPIDASASASSVELQIGTFHRPGPPLELSVHTAGGPAGKGALRGGYPDNSRPRVNVAGIKEGERFFVCVRNAGQRRVALYGGAPGAARNSAVFLEGKEQPADLTLIFHRDEPRSVLSLLPTVFDRATLFTAAWIGPWLLWLMAAAVVIAVPLLLALALASAGPVAADRRDRSL